MAERADGLFRFWGGAETVADWDGGYGEARVVTWPLYIMVQAYRYTGEQKYWTKAEELFRTHRANEQRSGGLGYITNSYADVGNVNNAQAAMSGYAVPGVLAYADIAIAKGTWTARCGTA